MVTLQMIINQLNYELIEETEIRARDLIKSVRIRSGMELRENILYLSGTGKEKRTCCQTAGGSSFFYRADLSDVLNRIFEIMEYYAEWERSLENSIHRGCTLSELLDLAYPVISHPLIILDSNEWVIAYSSVLETADFENNQDLSDLIRFHSSSPEKIAAFNKEYYSCFQQKDIYQVPGDIFTTNAAYAMNLFHESQFTGVLLIDSFDLPIAQGKLDLFWLLGIQIQKMLNDPSSGLSIKSEDAALGRYLNEPSENNMKILQHDLQIMGWDDRDEKQILFIAPSVGSSLSPNLNHALLMFNRLFGLKAAEYKDGIILFVNRKHLDERYGYESIVQRIRQLSYSAGVSNIFYDLAETVLMSKRAYAALSAGVQDPGAINCFSDYYMPYFFSLISETERKLLRHPLLNRLRKYDQRTGSDLYQTLFFYLKNERGISKTAREMNIHRSTLLHRIERIGELSDKILNDPDQRMHILISYYLEKYESLQLSFD